MATHTFPATRRAASLLSASLAIMVATAPAATGSPAVTVSIHGTEVVLPIPDGHCVLSDANAADRQRLSIVKRVNKGRNIVLALFADCAKLRAFRETGARLGGLGSYLAPASGAKRRYSMSRDRFVALMAKNFAGREGRAAIAKAQAEAKRRIKDIDRRISLNENVNLGLVHKDETGVYSGAVQNWQNEGEAPIRFAVVFGLTLVRHKIVTTQVSRSYEGQETIERLVAADRAFVRRLIEANGG